MSDIQMLFERLNGVEATIAEATRDTSAPLSRGAEAMLRSLERRRDELREMADALAAERLIDVCDYRLVPNRLNRYPVREVGQSLSRFQDMVTSFFAAVRDNKARERAVYDNETIDASTLNLGYSYPGSLGLVMYVPNDQLLLTETDLDVAVSTIMGLVETETVGEVRGIADRFGKAAVRSFYVWSKAHTEADLSVDIKWQRGKEIKYARVVQPAELERVQGIIKVADKRDDSVNTYEGILVALNVKGQGSFKMAFPDPEMTDISGKLDKAFPQHRPHKVPSRYRATLRKITYTSLWSADERIEWELIDLDEVL